MMVELVVASLGSSGVIEGSVVAVTSCSLVGAEKRNVEYVIINPTQLAYTYSKRIVQVSNLCHSLHYSE